MRTPGETARRWLAQAENELNITRSLTESGFWSGACFHAEQTAQLALKAFLYLRGHRFINIHSIRALVQECGKEDSQFLTHEGSGLVLDRYYLATRYPDVLPPPALPFESFTEPDARQALNFAEEIFSLAKQRIENVP
ncbi:MAG TPA: HEPN domain-containing protein [Dehalococcoidia bacterium]|nr:HEPN domain-containing protein [Dehalococcoidia bacterium]